MNTTFEMSREEMDQMKDQIADLHRALLGDKFNKDGGLITRVQRMEQYIESDKRMKWMGAGVIAFVTWISTHAKDIWYWFTNK